MPDCVHLKIFLFVRLLTLVILTTPYRGIDHHDDETISYCQSKGIVYESYDALKGCPTKDADVVSIAAAHNVSTYQVHMDRNVHARSHQFALTPHTHTDT